MLLIALRLFLIAALLLGTRIVAGLFISPLHMARLDDSVRRTTAIALALAACVIAILSIVYLASRILGPG